MAIGSLMSFQPPAEPHSYEAFFGLKEKPFGLNADPRFLYNSPSHAAAFENVLGGIRRREGLLVLTGEIGTGKTMLCRAVLRSLGRKTYSSFVPDPFASREDMLKTLLIDFGMVSVQELTNGTLKNASRAELSFLLTGFLDSLSAHEAYVVVVIDEAQNMSLSMIEETRILADSFGSKGHLQILFVGQPELLDKLKLPEMRQVDQRVCGYNRLMPLGPDAIGGYIQHRLHVAGAGAEQVLFAPELVELIHSRSGGVPRLVNRICDRALQLAHRERAAAVDQHVLENALAEIGPTTLTPTWSAIMSAMPEAEALSAYSASSEVVTSVEENFSEELDQWLKRDLRPTTRKPASIEEFSSEPAEAAGARATAAGGATARRRPRAIAFWRDTGRQLRNETYMQRLGRVWTKRAAIAAVLFVAFKAAALGAATLSSNFERLMLDAPELPELTGLPSLPVPHVGPRPGPMIDTADRSPVQLRRTAAGGPAAVDGHVVAVGVFASQARADRLLDELIGAGLPAAQRPYRLRTQVVQQVVLGPFPTREEAMAALQRLRVMGGYADAHVIGFAAAESTQ